MLKKIQILLFLILCFQIKAQNNDTIPKNNPIENNQKHQEKNKFITSIKNLIYRKKTTHKNTTPKENIQIKPFDYDE